MTKEDLAFIKALREQGVEVTFSKPDNTVPELQGGQVENIPIDPETKKPFLAQDRPGKELRRQRRSKAKNIAEARRLRKKQERLKEARSDENVQWLLYNIYKHESDKDSEGNVNLGGFNLSAGDSSAFGGGQFIGDTRNSILERYGVDAWSANPIEQELASIALIDANGLLGKVKRGQFKGNSLTKRVKVKDKNKPKGFRMDVQNWEAFVDDNAHRLINKPEDSSEWLAELRKYRTGAVYKPSESFSKIDPKIQKEKADVFKKKYGGTWPTGESVTKPDSVIDFTAPGDSSSYTFPAVNIIDFKNTPELQEGLVEDAADERSYAQILEDAEKAQKANSLQGRDRQKEIEDLSRKVLKKDRGIFDITSQQDRDSNPLSYLPGTSEALDAVSVGQAIEEGNYGDAAMYGAGFLIPFVPGSAVKKGVRTVLQPVFDAAKKAKKTSTGQAALDHAYGLKQGLLNFGERPFFEMFPITSAQKEAVALKQNEAYMEGIDFVKDWAYDSSGNLRPFVKQRMEAIPNRGGMANSPTTVGQVPDLLVSTRRADNTGLNALTRQRISKTRGGALGVNYSESYIPESITFRNKGFYQLPAEDVAKTGVHEGAHTLQREFVQEFTAPGEFDLLKMSWLDYLEEPKYYPSLDKNYGAVTGEFSELGKKMEQIMDPDSYWFGSPGEVHSELMSARFTTAKNLVNKGYVDNMAQARELMQSPNLTGSFKEMVDEDVYKNFMNTQNGRNQDFFKESIFDPKNSDYLRKSINQVFNRLPAATGIGVAGAAAANAGSEPQLRQGGMEQQRFSKEDLAFMKALRDQGVEVTFSGYKNDSPDRNNAANLIPSGNITMENVDKPVFAMDSKGNSTVMEPGQNYEFEGNAVLEIPMAKSGMVENGVPLLQDGHLELYGGPQNSLVATATPVEGTMFGGSNFNLGEGYSAPAVQTYTMDPMQTGNMTASDTTGEDPMSTTTAGGSGFGMSDAMAIGAGVANISQSLAQLGPESSTEVGSVSGMGGSREQAIEGTIGGTLSSIPIVGQFYQIGAGIGSGFEAGANAFYEAGNDAGGYAMTALQGAVDPSSQWGRNAELWEAGYLSDGEAALNFIGGFFGFGGGPMMDERVRTIQGQRLSGAMARATGGLHTTPSPSAESAGKFSKATGYPKPKRT